MTTATPSAPSKDGPWLLLKWLLPLFAIVFGVNGYMVYKAESTFNGVTTPHAYEEGLAYNQTLKQREAQAKLGWAFTTHQQGRKLTLTGTDATQAPLAGAKVTALLQRPTVAGQDAPVTLTEPTPGHYEADLTPLAHGQWEATFTVEKPAADGTPQTFTLQTRLMLD